MKVLNLTQKTKTQNSTSGSSLDRRLGSFHRAKVVSMCSRVAVMLSRCSLSLSLSPSSWGCQGALVCAGRPRGLVFEAFLQQTRQQAPVFESSLEIVLCNSQKCPSLCASSWHFCKRIGHDNRPQYLNLLEKFSFVTPWSDQIQFNKAKIMWNLGLAFLQQTRPRQQASVFESPFRSVESGGEGGFWQIS